jgi:hypothetical protein
VECAVQQQTPSMTAPVDLIDQGTNLAHNTASRLTPISAHVANLRKLAAGVLRRFPPPPDAIGLVLRLAHEIDGKLQAWAHSVSPTWLFHPATGIQCPTHVPRERFLYRDRMDMYEDVNIANVWNNYRANRIVIANIVLACLSRQGIPPTHAVAQLACQVMQELVDDICGSVPFHLGTKMCGGPRDRDEVQYPYRGLSRLSPAHRQACAAYGGWYVLDALKVCLGVDGLREGQMPWIIGQMKRIGILYGFKTPVDGEGEGNGTGEGRGKSTTAKGSGWESHLPTSCMG